MESTHSAAFGVSFPIGSLSALREYIDNQDIEIAPTLVCIEYIDVIPAYLFSQFNRYDTLWGNQLPKPQFAISHIRINSSQIYTIGRGNTIKFVYNDLTYIKFFVSNAEKEQYFIGQNVDLDVNIVGELSINEYNGNITNQVIINQMECNKVENKFDWNEIFS